jgi:peptidoglycan hydrolase-like protein with peptidoglycan-binding domain
MANNAYFVGGFGYRQANDEDELGALASLLQQQGVLGAAGGGAPPYYTEALNEGVKAVQRRNGLEPDGDARPGSPTLRVLNEMAAGFPRAGFIHGDQGAPLESAGGTSCRRRRSRQRTRRGQGGDLSLGRARPRPALSRRPRALIRQAAAAQGDRRLPGSARPAPNPGHRAQRRHRQGAARGHRRDDARQRRRLPRRP